VLELGERGAGVDPELVCQDSARLGQRAERVRLAPAAVQRQHQQAVQLLAQRVFARKRLDPW